MDHPDERDLIRYCGQTGTAVVTYEPLGSGILTGAVTRDTDPISVWGEDFVEWGFCQRLFAPGKIERSLAVVDRLREMAERLDITVPKLALASNLAQPLTCGSFLRDTSRARLSRGRLAHTCSRRTSS